MKLAMVFPGQGSQSAGMQAALAAEFPEVRRVYEEAGDTLGVDLWRITQATTQEQLDETVNTQPAMLAAGYACWTIWKQRGGCDAVFMAGHSLGEYTALVCAGAIQFADALRLVRRRAELMQAAVPAGQGAMAALLGLDDAAVIDVCEQVANGEVVSAVNFNAPGQVVIAGDKAAVERATVAAKSAGAKRAILLNVSVPSHCELMRDASVELADTLATAAISETGVPVINNADVVPYVSVEQIRDGLRRQLFSPVRWVETIKYMVTKDAGLLVECGPGKVLAGLTRRIDRSLAAEFIDSPESLDNAIHAASSTPRI